MANLTPVNSFDNVIQLETNTIALGGVGGIMNAQAQALLNRTYYLKTIVDNLIVDALNSTDDTKALSAKQGKALSDSLANKLDASAYVQHYRGKFVSLVALQTALPTANDGDYAIVDAGGGNDAVYYIWDAQEGWVSGGATTASTTDDVTEGSTNLYFTSARAISAVTATINTAVAASLDATVNTQTVTSYTLGTVTTDNDGKTYLRMTSASANTVTIPSTQTKPISISQRGAGTTTLVAGSGVTLNGTLAFTAQHQTKTVILVSGSTYDVVG